MIKYTNKRVISVHDWDRLVTEVYGRTYNFQQQDGCQSRGTYELSISTEEIDDSDSETDSDDENFEEVKVLKINIPSDNDSLSSQINLDINNDLTELDDNFLDNESETDENNLEEDITLEEVPNNLEDNLKIDLKKISINLEEPHNLTMDYKKLSLTKLRSVVSEKSLSNDASKLKKNELLKLLGVE
jgi:hypothetical protein